MLIEQKRAIIKAHFQLVMSGIQNVIKKWQLKGTRKPRHGLEDQGNS